MEGQSHQPRPQPHSRGLEMIAVAIAASQPAAHEQHHLRARSPGGAPLSAHYRLLAGFSHHVLHRLLCVYQKLVGAAILASVLNAYGATLSVMMARQTCPAPAERVGKNAL